MPYLSITCVISYVIGHALGPSTYPELLLCFRCPVLHHQHRHCWLELPREAPGGASPSHTGVWAEHT